MRPTRGMRTAILEELISHPNVPDMGEDSQEDFLFPLVGLGRTFVQSLASNLNPAIQIAADDTFVESFRYVLDGCRCFYSLREYVDVFVANQRFARSHSQPACDTMRKVDDETPGIVFRAGATSYKVITPIDSRTIPNPKRPAIPN